MSRYIDADELMSRVVKKKPEIAKERYIEGFNDAILRFRSMIHGAPTVDAVEVVRCKDCEYWTPDEIGRRYCNLIDCWTGDTDFCSRGRKHTEDKNNGSNA